MEFFFLFVVEVLIFFIPSSNIEYHNRVNSEHLSHLFLNMSYQALCVDLLVIYSVVKNAPDICLFTGNSFTWHWSESNRIHTNDYLRLDCDVNRHMFIDRNAFCGKEHVFFQNGPVENRIMTVYITYCGTVLSSICVKLVRNYIRWCEFRSLFGSVISV